MAMSRAVQDAADLLRSRLAEARDEHSRLSEEIAQIEGALERLGFGLSEAPRVAVAADIVEVQPTLGPNMPISALTRILLEAEEGPWTPRTAGERLKEEVPGIQGERTNEQFYNTVGAAFYHMRKRGEAVTDRFSNTRATKWSQDAEAPAGTGASDGEEPSEGSFWKEGGTGYDPAPPDGRGADTGDTESRHGHGNGASISEAPAL